MSYSCEMSQWGLKSSHIRVRGESMWPTLQSGDRVAVMACAQPQVGDLVLAWLRNHLIVHRVLEATDSRVVLKGDNCARPDPHLPREAILGVVARVFRGPATLAHAHWQRPPSWWKRRQAWLKRRLARLFFGDS
jgi:signal peptidase I